jgi:hypothetical protein
VGKFRIGKCEHAIHIFDDLYIQDIMQRNILTERVIRESLNVQAKRTTSFTTISAYALLRRRIFQERSSHIRLPVKNLNLISTDNTLTHTLVFISFSNEYYCILFITFYATTRNSQGTSTGSIFACIIIFIITLTPRIKVSTMQRSPEWLFIMPSIAPNNG